jgi:hypothetical protein
MILLKIPVIYIAHLLWCLITELTQFSLLRSIDLFLFYLNLPGFFLTRVEVLLDLSTRVRKKNRYPTKS